MFDWLKVLLNPSCWIMIKTYSKAADVWAKEVLKNPEIIIEDKYYARINNIRCWITNRPYGFELIAVGLRPSRANILRLYELIDRELIKYAKGKEISE